MPLPSIVYFMMKPTRSSVAIRRKTLTGMELPRFVEALLTENRFAAAISARGFGSTDITLLFKTPWVNPR